MNFSGATFFWKIMEVIISPNYPGEIDLIEEDQLFCMVLFYGLTFMYSSRLISFGGLSLWSKNIFYTEYWTRMRIYSYCVWTKLSWITEWTFLHWHIIESWLLQWTSYALWICYICMAMGNWHVDIHNEFLFLAQIPEVVYFS